VRVGRLGTAAGKLSRAMAVLGDDAPLRQAAHLAGLSLDDAAAAADALARVEILLDREPLRFVHPLVAHAVRRDIPTSERAGRHLDAARLLYADGAEPERVAAHLLLGRAEGDGWVVDQLCAAARDARSRGAPQSAASYLRRVLELAERAWDEGCVLERAASQWIGWRLTAEAFLLGGELERAVEVADAAIEDARRRTWPLAFATARFFRALPELGQGRVDASLADLESARGARRYGWRQFSRMAAAQYALCLIERDEVARAEEVLLQEGLPSRPRDLEDAMCTYAVGAVRLAQSQPDEALELALLAGRVVERTLTVFGFCPWRTAAAQAAVALGDRERALALAGEAHSLSERTGVLHQRIRALRVLGLSRQGEAAIATLRAAVDLGRGAPPRLETVRALVDLGAAMRRANQRTASREPLQLAADMALHGGATALHARARTELAATGARPRRIALLSGPASLTPSERRIAELAAGGQGNREIAQALFVTPKTVEYHLRNAYRKLGIEKRQELSGALEPSRATG
jgi:DNA-binding CsgD family transcriptional regulator